jgi:hypothetical protein
MKHFALCSWVLLAMSAGLDAQLKVPQLGVARYADGSVHPIRGVAANFIVEPRAIARADGASFSDSAGLLAINGWIRLLRADGALLGEYPSAEPLPLLDIDSSAQSAAVWLPSKHMLLRWNGTQFVETPIDDSSFAGRVTFVSLASNTTAHFFVVLADSSVTRISVALPSGRVTSSDLQPGSQGSVSTQQGWIISQDAWGLIAERPGANRQTLQLSRQALPADDLTMEKMSNHWLHVTSRSTGTGWAVYLDTAKLNVFLLPSPVARVAR